MKTLRRMCRMVLVLGVLGFPVHASAADMYAAAIGEPPPPRAPAQKPAAPAPVPPATAPTAPAPAPDPDTTAAVQEEPPADTGMRNKILIGAAVALGLAALGGGGGSSAPASTSATAP